MTPEERQTRGAAINALKNEVTDAIAERKSVLKMAAVNARLKAETVDVSLPVRSSPAERGRIHPISQIVDEITAIFADMLRSFSELGPLYAIRADHILAAPVRKYMQLLTGCSILSINEQNTALATRRSCRRLGTSQLPSCGEGTPRRALGRQP